MSFRVKNVKELDQYMKKAENNILRHAIGQQAADIVINRMAELRKDINKLQRENAELKGEFKTMASQTRKAYADKMITDMADNSS